jgi:nucleoside-diphosphate-sugar epimerase
MLAGAAEIRLDRAKAVWRWTRGAVEDVADAIALAATDVRASGRVYNLGEEPASSEAEWIRAIGEAVGWTGHAREVPREELPEEEREPYDFAHDLVADTGRIRRELGFVERVGREESLRRAVAAERLRPEAISGGRDRSPG